MLVFDEGTGELTDTKLLSTTDDPSEGVVTGIERVCEKVGISFSDLRLLLHGTMVDTNIILTNTGARAGLLTTLVTSRFGLGDPLERDPECVANNIRWNLVTRRAADEEYGIVLNDGGEVDTEETDVRRDGLRAKRAKELSYFDPAMLPSLEEQRKEGAESQRRFDEWPSKELG